jgi:transcriptional regulator with XRE-family HTH domain
LRAGTSQNAISRLERDEISPSMGTIERLLAAMGERLELRVRRIDGDFDPDHLADSMAQTMSERLERSLEWNRFAGRLTGVTSSDGYEAEGVAGQFESPPSTRALRR